MRARNALLILVLAACARSLPDGAVRTVVERSGEGKRVIFVGLDGADWRLLDQFMAEGTMPRVREIVSGGERRVLLTQHPPLSPLVWTSMMTGTSPLEHRILDFTRFNPATHAQEPITSDERAVPAIWNMARAGGKSAAVFGLWATYPAEPGVVITDRDLPRDYVAATDQLAQKSLQWIAAKKPDLSIVYVQGTDEIGHFTSGNVDAARPYFRRIDTILGQFRDAANDLDAELIIASDHGFDWGGAHPESSTATATAAKWHREEGVWIRWPHARVVASPAHVDQVCATLLEILGLPPAEEIAPAIGDASSRASVNYRRYYKRAIDPDRNRRTEVRRSTGSDGARDAEAVAKLKALGYIGSDDVATGPANMVSTRTPASYNNEGLILRQSGKTEEAEAAFRAALALNPRYASARQNLDDLLAARGVERLRARDCKGALADFRSVSRESALLWASIAAAEGCVGDDRAAEAAVRRSLALNPDQPELRRLLVSN